MRGDGSTGGTRPSSPTLQVVYVAFDLLFLNGVPLLRTPLAERRRLLRSAFVEVPDRFSFAVSGESTDLDAISAMLGDAVKGSCEGLMVKASARRVEGHSVTASEWAARRPHTRHTPTRC